MNTQSQSYLSSFDRIKLEILCSHNAAQQTLIAINNKVKFSLLPKGASIPRASDSLIIYGYSHDGKLICTRTLKDVRKYIAGYILEYFECGYYNKFPDFVSTKIGGELVYYWECRGERRYEQNKKG